MTTIDDIDAIRQREQAATPGPWHTWTVDPRPRFQVGTTTPFRPVAEVYERDERGNDAEFIAHARTDVPALLAKVDELTAALAAKDAVVDAAKAWRAQFGEWGPLDSADTPSGDLTDAVDALPKAEATR